MNRLPHWVLTDRNPAFFDSESATVIEQTARVYAKMQELVDEYNKYIDGINSEIESFENDIKSKLESFTNYINETMLNYIECIDDKNNAAIYYMKTNLVTTLTDLFNAALQDGSIQTNLAIEYDENNENMTLKIVEKGGI